MLNKKNLKFEFLKYYAIGAAFAFLACVTAQVFFPSVPSNAATSATASAELQLVIEPTLEMAIDKTSLSLQDGQGNTEILPTAAGTLATGDVNVYVTSNSSSYTLKLYSQSETNSMKNINTDITESIAPISTSASSLPGGTWGFKYGSNQWQAVGLSATGSDGVITNNGAQTTICNTIATNPEGCASGSVEKRTITFGASITENLPSGRYTNDVVFSAIANPPSRATQ